MTAIQTWPRVRIRLPFAPAAAETGAPTYDVNGPVAGLRVGLRHSRAWRSWVFLVEEWARVLRAEGGHVEILEVGERVGSEGGVTRSGVQEWVASIDCAISGLGNCGSCTSWAIADAVAAEAAGKPSIAAVTAEFEHHARVMASSLGHGDLRLLVLPYPLEGLDEDTLAGIASEYLPKALSALGVHRASG